MTQDKSRLTAFTLKLSKDDLRTMKLLCAVDESFKYQYQMLDAAVYWAVENRNRLVAMAGPKEGGNRSYYVSEAVAHIGILENAWNCNSTRALYTAVVTYLKHREGSLIADGTLL